jgi:hypothetical protein
MSGSLHEIPVILKTIGAVAGVLGVLLFLWLAWHGLRRVLDSPRIPMSRATYMVFGLLCVVMLAIAAFPLGVGRVLRDHARVDGQRTQVAEVRCAPGPQGKVRITFAPTGAGQAAPEQIESTGPSCRLSAEVVTLRALPARLGLGTLVRVTQVGEAARPSEAPDWMLPVPDVAPAFPMALVVRQARRVSLQAQPDAAAVYHLVASPDGLALHTAGATAERPSGG